MHVRLSALALAGVMAGCTAPNPAYEGRVASAEDVASGGGDAPAIVGIDGRVSVVDAVAGEGPSPMPDSAAIVAPARDAAAADAKPDSGPARADAPTVVADAAATADAAPSDAPVHAGTDGPVPVFSFDNGDEGWGDLRFEYYKVAETPVSSSTWRVYQGHAALAIDINTTGSYRLPTVGKYVETGLRPNCGDTVTYRLWFPTRDAIEALQPFVMYYPVGGGALKWGSPTELIFTESLTPNVWNTVTFKTPACASKGIVEMGIEWRTRGTQKVTVYVDSVTW